LASVEDVLTGAHVVLWYVIHSIGKKHRKSGCWVDHL